MSVPQFSEDSTEQTLDANDDLSDSPVKGALKWEKRDSQYVFLWYQTPFYVATPNGGYSMTESLLEKLPPHIDTIWVVDDEHRNVLRFDRDHWEDDSVREVIEPDDGRFNNVNPERQIAVDTAYSDEVYDLREVSSLQV